MRVVGGLLLVGAARAMLAGPNATGVQRSLWDQVRVLQQYQHGCLSAQRQGCLNQRRCLVPAASQSGCSFSARRRASSTSVGTGPGTSGTTTTTATTGSAAPASAITWAAPPACAMQPCAALAEPSSSMLCSRRPLPPPSASCADCESPPSRCSTRRCCPLTGALHLFGWRALDRPRHRHVPLVRLPLWH